jgi:hypothetical protein
MPTLDVVFDQNDKRDLYFLPREEIQRRAGISDREELWIRLRVTNTSGTANATGVAVKVVGLLSEGHEEDENVNRQFLKVSRAEHVRTTIEPQFSQHYDLLYLRHITTDPPEVSAFAAFVSDDRFEWDKEKERIEREQAIPVGRRCWISFALVGDTSEATYYIAEFLIKSREQVTDGQMLSGELGRDELIKRLEWQQLWRVSSQNAFNLREWKDAHLLLGVRRVLPVAVRQ